MGVTFNPFTADNPVVALLAVLTLVIDVGLVISVIYFLLERKGISLDLIENRIRPALSEYFTELSFIFALGATSGSLYMSNVLGWEPCKMCWYQRIFMYPLVIVLGVGLLFADDDARDYAIPLALIGFPIAVYHRLVQRVEQFQSAGCSVTAVSCSTEYTFWFGYITIPVMAATAFAAVILLMWRFGGEWGQKDFP